MSFPTVAQLARDIREGKVTASAVLEEHLKRVDAREGEIHAFNLVTTENARAAAAEVDRAVQAGKPLGPLAGVLGLIGRDWPTVMRAVWHWRTTGRNAPPGGGTA